MKYHSSAYLQCCSRRRIVGLVVDYCTISFSSARGRTRDRLAEIWTSAILGVDRGHVQISAKARWYGMSTELGCTL